MNAKAKGTRNEHKTIVWLEERGWLCTRSAASLGLFDVVGFNENNIVAAQVKSNHIAGPEERRAIEAFAAPANVLRLLFTWVDRDPEPRIHLLINYRPVYEGHIPLPHWMELQPMEKEALRARNQ